MSRTLKRLSTTQKFMRAAEAHRKAGPIRSRSGILHSLDVTAKNLRDHAEFFLRTGRGKLIEKAEADFVSGVKDSFGGTLRILLEGGENLHLDVVQKRTLATFIEKISSTHDARSLIDALEFFNRNSCILKLPAQK